MYKRTVEVHIEGYLLPKNMYIYNICNYVFYPHGYVLLPYHCTLSNTFN